MEIYIKPAKKASVAERKELRIKDFCEVSADKGLMDKVKNLAVCKITAEEKSSFLVTIIDIVRVIKRVAPDAQIVNVGEIETMVEYAPKKSKDNRVMGWLKVAFVTTVLFMGSATAIISFYSDAQMSQVFENMHQIIFGVKSSNPLIIEIPFCIGLATGIIAFFNHVGGKRITADPTPIEVEMSKYDADVTDTMLEMLNQERRNESSGGEAGGNG